MPPVLVRVSLWYLALSGFFPGVWAGFFPRSFYDDFPGGGMTWVAAEPPFNEHLVRDVGGFFLALGILALCAALSSNRTLVRVTGVVWVVFATVHLSYHLRHLDRYDEAALNVIALSIPVVAAIVAIVGAAAVDVTRREPAS